MSKFNDGGPAFPRPASERGTRDDAQTGMTLHQYFAGLAMQAKLNREFCGDYTELADHSLAVADAMVAAYGREKGTEENKSSISPDMSILRRAFEAGTDFEYANPRDTKPDGEDEAFENFVKSILADGMKIKAGTIEVHTAPKGAYEALVYDLAKMLGCAEDEKAVKNAAETLKQTVLQEQIKDIGRKGKM